MILLDFIPFHNIIEEIKPETDRHYYEMTEGDEYGPPDIDWELYEELSHAGRAVAVTLRDAGKLVGYCVFVIGTSLRYKARIEADSEGIFIEKAYRQNSDKFIKYAIATLKTIGVQKINFTLSDDKLGKWLARYGAKSNYKVWSI